MYRQSRICGILCDDPIYMVLPFFQVMCKGMSRKLERTLLVVCGASVVFNYMVSLQNGEAYYDLPLVGDKVYMFYSFIGYLFISTGERSESARKGQPQFLAAV